MLTAAFVIAGGIALYFFLWWIVQREEAQVHKTMPRRGQGAVECDPGHAHPGLAGHWGDESVRPYRNSFDDLAPETLADIEQTVAAMVGAEVRIKAIRPVPVVDPGKNAWARDGLLMVQKSHDLPLLRTRNHPPAVLPVVPTAASPRTMTKKPAA